jgi:hypothetical protein
VAADWIKIRNDLDEDPHVLRLQDLLGSPDIDLVVGKLRRLWKYADRHTTDGRIPFANEARIDQIVNLPGFAAALRSVGWLEFQDGWAIIPRFEEHNGQSAKSRAQNTRRQNRCRADSATKARQQRDQRRGEKRREEKKQGVSPPETPVAADKPPPVGKPSETAPTPSDNRPSETARTPPDTSRTATKPRPPDPLFDAVAEVTASDPTVSGSHIGRVCKLLRGADPPYTPDEVRRWAALVCQQWPNQQGPPTLGMIEKHIGRVRALADPGGPVVNPLFAGVREFAARDGAGSVSRIRATDGEIAKYAAKASRASNLDVIPKTNGTPNRTGTPEDLA